MSKVGLVFSPAAIAFIASVLICGQAVAAQQEPAVPALDLSSDIQSPGSEALITISLSAQEGVTIGKAVAEITYPGKILEFLEARRGLSAEAVEAEVAAVTENPAADQSTVRVTIAAKEGDWIPSGILAELHFKIVEKAPDETPAALKNKVSAWSDKTPPTLIEPITGKDGEIKITANPPVFACFFYMH